MPSQQFKTLSEVSADIWNADLILFRSKGLVSREIRRLGRGAHSHAAKATRCAEILFCAEVREWYGGRLVTLESQVRQFPGQLDVFRTNPDNLVAAYDREAANKMMIAFAGQKYGYLDILATFAVHHLFRPANMDDDYVSKRPPYCSAACAIADRVGGGVDPVPYLADNETEPSDLARSRFYRYQFTLIPDPAPTVAGKKPETNEAARMMARAAASGATPVAAPGSAGADENEGNKP
jgi:hypothetical protein